MIKLVAVSALERSVKSIFIIGLILLVRKQLNIKSIKRANIILWSMLFIYLLFPYSILIKITNQNQYDMWQSFLKPLIWFGEYIREFEKEAGYILSENNQLFVSILLLVYVIFQIVKRNNAMKGSVLIEKDSRVINCLNLFRLKRQVDIFVNNRIKVPITYGVIHPKIILQSSILDDNELLKYVIIHEMIHIKKFDIVFNHLKNLVTCLYWYNIFIIIASRYIEDDIEALCDKLVIQKVGDTVCNRKEYCLSMLKLIEQKEEKRKATLKLHPTTERIIIMKQWKKGLSGVCAFVLALALSSTVFADVTTTDKAQIISSETPSQDIINENDRVKEITDEEYNSLTLAETPSVRFKIANINSKITLGGLEHRSYKFNMISRTEPYHDGFTVKMSDMSSKSGLNYAIIIKEDGNDIYNKSFNKATTLTIKAYHGSSYEVIINNQSTNSLTYRVKINSYIR